MMEKIIDFSLKQAGFKNPESLKILITSSENPEVALEMILGIWEMPEIKENSTNNQLNGIENSTRKFVEYMPLKSTSSQVKYKYESRREIIIYYSKDEYKNPELAKAAYYADPSAWVNWNGSDKNYVYVKTGEIRILETTCSLEKWNK